MSHCGDSLSLIVALRACFRCQLREAFGWDAPPAACEHSQCTQEHVGWAELIRCALQAQLGRAAQQSLQTRLPSTPLTMEGSPDRARRKTGNEQGATATPTRRVAPVTRKFPLQDLRAPDPSLSGEGDTSGSHRSTGVILSSARKMALRRGSSLSGLARRGLGQLQSELSSTVCAAQAEAPAPLNG